MRSFHALGDSENENGCDSSETQVSVVESHFRQSPVKEKAQQHGQTKVSKQEKAIEPKWQE